jgi:hypothetical protein
VFGGYIAVHNDDACVMHGHYLSKGWINAASQQFCGQIWDKRSGAWGRIRTTDTRIFNPLLYQLSYPGQAAKAAAVAGAGL